MVPGLMAETSNPFDVYRSHPKKPLRIHANGVLEGVRRRTGLRIAEAAALFHDLGKLNPNFQPKLDGLPVTGYSSHAYLSAHSFLCFCKTNPRLLGSALGLSKVAQLFSVLSLIAHHHGNLPDMGRILKQSERERVQEFLALKPSLPISNYLKQWLEHEDFDVLNATHGRLMVDFWRISDTQLDNIADKLDFFLQTQFGFACLVEADKRDASDNKWFNRDEQLRWARGNFEPSMHDALELLTSDSELNQTRTAVRKEALCNLKQALEQGHRTFSLTAPTGAGKTFALLALADEIRRGQPDHAIVYALPFLTITEQVEAVCREDIFSSEPSFVTRIDSRAHNEALESLLRDLEEKPDRIAELLRQSFSNETFDAAFIITTFVQLFETLLSNSGATLLRLPNFAKCIILIDEIQALPPRLYVFLTAYLQAFCCEFDSYAVLSTATMPALNLPDKKMDSEEDARLLFSRYRSPAELLQFEKYYQLPVFDRYEIRRLDEDDASFSLSKLARVIQDEERSCLVILNTIEDTRKLYDLLSPNEFDKHRCDVVLLNTRFILDDRRHKIAECKERLLRKQRVVLISTQLIEAGVDIDFPVVLRDLCPLPSVIQSAGRCNRNGKLGRGLVWFFELRGDNGEVRAELIYRDAADQWILDFSREQVCGVLRESDLLEVQREYFDRINRNLAVGDHKLYADGGWKRDNLIRRINEGAFNVVGSFRLIDETAFGHELRYYVPAHDDDNWEQLERMTIESSRAVANAEGRLPFNEMKKHQVEIDIQLRRMSGRIVQARVRNERDAPPAEKRKGQVKEVCGLRKLLLPEVYYSSYTGIDLQGTIPAIL